MLQNKNICSTTDNAGNQGNIYINREIQERIIYDDEISDYWYLLLKKNNLNNLPRYKKTVSFIGDCLFFLNHHITLIYSPHFFIIVYIS
jgi:hypothetical protein